MTFEEFLIDVNTRIYEWNCTIKNTTIEESWYVGGYSGGNCWGGTAKYSSVGDENKPEFDVFDRIVEIYKPDISFFAYKRLRFKLIENFQSEINEYYGNSSIYNGVRFDLKVFYNDVIGSS